MLSVLRGSCPGGLQAAASGELANALTALFGLARDELVERSDDGVLLVVHTDEPPEQDVVLTTVRALTRGLAREFAPRRVNALVGGAQDEPLIDFLAGPASAALTGAVYDAR